MEEQELNVVIQREMKMLRMIILTRKGNKKTLLLFPHLLS